MPTLFGMPTVAELRVFPCTWCQAEPGQPCVRPDGSRRRSISHTPRWDAWAEQQQRNTVAVRTHVPILIDGLPVLIPIADADQIMRQISAAVWPDDPWPPLDDAFAAGYEAGKLHREGTHADPS